MLNDKSILITGGTGSFGNQFIKTVLNCYKPKKVIVYSRDELKQFEMQQKWPENEAMRYFIGDVRDYNRLKMAMANVDIVIHTAALKQVPAAEYNPFEAVLTNIIGAKNVIDASIDAGVKKVLAMSTDKAVNPVNLYGATKLVAEKLFVQGNSYAGWQETSFSCVRYGNVIGSRGSVIPLFKQQAKTGKITITDKRMTRFWISLEQGVRFVIKCIESMTRGEVFVPKIPSMRITDLAESIAPGCEWEIIDPRPGEKLHEVLISQEESRNTLDLSEMFVIQPLFPWWAAENWKEGSSLPDNFQYTSDTNELWLTRDQLLQIEDL